MNSAFLGLFFSLLVSGTASALTELNATSNPDLSNTFVAKPVDPKATEIPLPGSWSLVENWGGTLPATAKDVGIIGAKHAMSVDAPLGQAGDRPVIRSDPGGTLWFAHDFDQPLKLNGGELREVPRARADCASDIEITADSTITSQGTTTDPGHMLISGKVRNTAPATLTLGGEIQWQTDSRSTLSALIKISNGTVYLYDTEETGRLGSGEIRLMPETRLYLRGPRGTRNCRLTNDITGTGTIRGGEHPEGFTLFAHGITLHPGLPGQAGTLSVMGNFGFEPGSADHSTNKITVEVHGPGRLAEADYSQLVLRGRLTDSLDTVDLELLIDPSLSPSEVAHYSLTVMSVVDTDIRAFKPFHTVSILQGRKRGRAQMSFLADPEVATSKVTVTDITFPG